MSQANVSEAESQKQAKWNSWCSHKSRAARILGRFHLAGNLRRKSTARISLVSICRPLKLWSGWNSAAEIHSRNFCLSNCSYGDVMDILLRKPTARIFLVSDHSLIRMDISKERREGYLLGISAGYGRYTFFPPQFFTFSQQESFFLRPPSVNTALTNLRK